MDIRRYGQDEMLKNVLSQMTPGEEVSDERLRQLIRIQMQKIQTDDYIRLQDKRRLEREIYNAIRKFDVLQDFLEDECITEIMVNGKDNIFIEKGGGLYDTGKKFISREKLEDIVQQIASKGNRIVNEASPILDVRLEDGSRVNIVLPPVAIDGPVVTIRKFPKEAVTIENLICWGAITEEAADFLKQLVAAKYNIFISGGTGAGKTTFLNVLSNFIPSDERIITIEDSAELQLKGIKNLVRLEARNANVEGENEIKISELIKSALRMRPDRIIIGEIRDSTAVDMLSAFNTGHEGSLCTGHANSAGDMMSRLEMLVLMGIDIPLMAIRQQIASALDFIVHLGRLRDSSRKVLEISEVCGIEDQKIKLCPLYQFVEKKSDGEQVYGRLERTEIQIRNRVKFERMGVRDWIN